MIDIGGGLSLKETSINIDSVERYIFHSRIFTLLYNFSFENNSRVFPTIVLPSVVDPNFINILIRLIN